MSSYFEKIEQVIMEKGITELDIQNIDEIGFSISCGKVKLIVTIDIKKLFYIIDLKNHDYITSV